MAAGAASLNYSIDVKTKPLSENKLKSPPYSVDMGTDPVVTEVAAML